MPRTIAAPLALLALAALNLQCTPMPLSGPKIIAGSETTVSFQVGKAMNADAAARDYCAAYNRTAVRIGRGTLSADDLTSIVAYNCVRDDP